MRILVRPNATNSTPRISPARMPSNVNPGIGTEGEIVDDERADVTTCVSIMVLLTVTKNIVVTGDCVVRVAVEVAVAVYVDVLGVRVDV